MSNKVYIEQLVAGNMVRYARLSEIVQCSYAGSKPDKLNIFVDLNSILKPLYSIDYMSYNTHNNYEIVASVLNLCGHYRSFFSNLGISTNIFIIYGLNNPKSGEMFVKGYNQRFIFSYIKKPAVTKLIAENLSLLNLICKYIPGVFFYDIGSNEVSAMIDYILNYTKSKSLGIDSLVISKDIMALQLIPLDDVRILRPYKKEGQDLSYIVDNKNMWISFSLDYRKLKDRLPDIDIMYITNVLAMSRLPERDMPSLFSVPRAMSLIEEAVSKGYLTKESGTDQRIINEAIAMSNVTKNAFESECRYKAISVRFQSLYVIPVENPEFKTLRFTDLYDPNGLKQIMSQYFDKDVIVDLNRLQ